MGDGSSLLSPLIIVGIHRGKALEGVERPTSTIIYFLAITITACFLLLAGIGMNKSRTAGTRTPNDNSSVIEDFILRHQSQPQVSTTQVVKIPSNLPVTALPIRDPRTDALQQAHEMIEQIRGIYEQLLKERQAIDNANRLRGISSPQMSEEEKTDRDETNKRYERCCKVKALEIRDKLIAFCPGISDDAVITSTYEGVNRYDLNGVTKEAPFERNATAYNRIADDLAKLTTAVEKHCATQQ